MHFTNRIGKLNVAYFPPTLEELVVEDCCQKQEISTRAFPRDALHISFVTNRFFGNPDLACLPERIQNLFLSQNELTGPISLCFLPSQMIILDLSDNRISQKVVLYENLPETMTNIWLGANRRIGKLYALTDSQRVKNPNFFFGTKKGKVH